MQIVHPRCGGLDVHKKDVKACVLLTHADGTVTNQVRTFSTMTDGLLALADWLRALNVQQVAMESTGVYWRSVFNLLEDDCTVILVNAQHVKVVPGRKTDARDCEWIADLLQHGLLRGSFVPTREHRELRELVRYRTALVRERADEANRLQKTLEGANIKLASVATDITGKSGRAMLAALIDGTTDPVIIAALAKGRLREKREELTRAVDGRIAPHQRFLLVEQLSHIDTLEEAIDRVSAEVAARMEPVADQLAALDTIPGVSQRVAEIGTGDDPVPECAPPRLMGRHVPRE
jgi:transposase